MRLKIELLRLHLRPKLKSQSMMDKVTGGTDGGSLLLKAERTEMQQTPPWPGGGFRWKGHLNFCYS